MIDAKVLSEVVDCTSDNFSELLRLASLDPRTDLIGCDLTGVDFGPYDGPDLDLSHCVLRGANLSRVRSRFILSGADTTGAILPTLSREEAKARAIRERRVLRQNHLETLKAIALDITRFYVDPEFDEFTLFKRLTSGLIGVTYCNNEAHRRAIERRLVSAVARSSLRFRNFDEEGLTSVTLFKGSGKRQGEFYAPEKGPSSILDMIYVDMFHQRAAYNADSDQKLRIDTIHSSHRRLLRAALNQVTGAGSGSLKVISFETTSQDLLSELIRQHRTEPLAVILSRSEYQKIFFQSATSRWNKKIQGGTFEISQNEKMSSVDISRIERMISRRGRSDVKLSSETSARLWTFVGRTQSEAKNFILRRIWALARSEITSSPLMI